MADTKYAQWNDEDKYWRQNFRSRPYASTGDRDYDYFQPGYRYGFESAQQFHDKQWHEVEPDLAKNWHAFQHRASATWEQVKDAARDAWERITSKHPVGTH
jgi:hypothetical protein